MKYIQERQKVAETALAMLETGLVVNTSGNASIRIDDHVVITPSGRPYQSLNADDVVVLDRKGDVVEGDLVPSSETPLHLALYESNSETKAIVHTHSVNATALSTVFDELPSIHYQIADLGGPVPVAPYRTFGTPELATVVCDAMRGRTAALMKNHGLVTIGETIEKALARAVTLEWLARVYLVADAAGTPSLIDAEELERVGRKQAELAALQQQHLRNRRSAAS